MAFKVLSLSVALVAGSATVAGFAMLATEALVIYLLVGSAAIVWLAIGTESPHADAPRATSPRPRTGRVSAGRLRTH